MDVIVIIGRSRDDDGHSRTPVGVFRYLAAEGR